MGMSSFRLGGYTSLWSREAGRIRWGSGTWTCREKRLHEETKIQRQCCKECKGCLKIRSIDELSDQAVLDGTTMSDAYSKTLHACIIS